MKLGKTLYVTDRNDWRKWLSQNYNKEPEIWLVTYKKHTGKPSLPYEDSVEEALCYGWIDSIVKRIDEDRIAQRFSPRRENSNLSEMNRQRIRKLIKTGKMTKIGLDKIKDKFNEPFIIPNDILISLKQNKKTWQNFQMFPGSYQRIRIGWVDGARKRPEEFRKRLNYLLKMTERNKRFGMV